MLFYVSHAIRFIPKGLVHTTGGYALYAMHTTANSFGLRQQTAPSDPDAPKDVYACVADAGWITGHTYIVSIFLVASEFSLILMTLVTYWT